MSYGLLRSRDRQCGAAAQLARNANLEKKEGSQPSHKDRAEPSSAEEVGKPDAAVPLSKTCSDTYGPCLHARAEGSTETTLPKEDTPHTEESPAGQKHEKKG